MTESKRKAYLIDTHIAAFKWTTRRRLLLLGEDSLLVGKREDHYGLKDITKDPEFLGTVVPMAVGPLGYALLPKLAKRTSKKQKAESQEFERIRFKDIIAVKKRRTLMLDTIIDIFYRS